MCFSVISSSAKRTEIHNQLNIVFFMLKIYLVRNRNRPEERRLGTASVPTRKCPDCLFCAKTKGVIFLARKQIQGKHNKLNVLFFSFPSCNFSDCLCPLSSREGEFHPGGRPGKLRGHPQPAPGRIASPRGSGRGSRGWPPAQAGAPAARESEERPIHEQAALAEG